MNTHPAEEGGPMPAVRSAVSVTEIGRYQAAIAANAKCPLGTTPSARRDPATGDAQLDSVEKFRAWLAKR